MKNEALVALAGSQRNRVARSQLLATGFTRKAIQHKLARGLLVQVHEGVYALPPVLDDELALWTGVTLTAPETYLSRLSAACAFGVLEHRPSFETVVRPGVGGPRRLDGILVYKSLTLEGETTTFEGLPITSIPRTLLDLASFASDAALARALRDSVRLELTTVPVLGDHLGRFKGRRGAPRLARAIARYRGLPLERARSGAEIRAMELLRDAGRTLPLLNAKVAGLEADLVWRRERVIIEIDGGPYHQDVGADAHKDAIWRGAGFEVRRIPSEVVYEAPGVFLAHAPR